MTDQLDKWQSEFGDEYTTRNLPGADEYMARTSLWTNIAMNVVDNLPNSVLEVGAGAGVNLSAIRTLYTSIGKEINLSAIEPNKRARDILKSNEGVTLIEKDISDIQAPNYNFDLVFTSGVLIHVHPDNLSKAMSEIYRVAKNFIVCIEYFSPECREVKYRDQDNMLWSNDFGKLWLKSYPLRCRSYGFAWKEVTKLDNLTWWVMEKVN